MDGITSLYFNVSQEPYPYAYLLYAHFQSGTYHEVGTWVPIKDALDNSPTFCQ